MLLLGLTVFVDKIQIVLQKLYKYCNSHHFLYRFDYLKKLGLRKICIALKFHVSIRIKRKEWGSNHSICEERNFNRMLNFSAQVFMDLQVKLYCLYGILEIDIDCQRSTPVLTTCREISQQDLQLLQQRQPN